MPANPGVCAPPPIVPASVENDHSRRGYALEFAVHDHDPVDFREHEGNCLETAAAGHRVFHNGIERAPVDLSVACLLDEPVHPLELPVLGIDHCTFLNRLVCTGRRYLVRNLPVKPARWPRRGPAVPA